MVLLSFVKRNIVVFFSTENFAELSAEEVRQALFIGGLTFTHSVASDNIT
jgi:hypothetical protein